MRSIVHGTSRVDLRAAARRDRRLRLARQTAVVLAWTGLVAAAIMAVAGVLLLVDHWQLI